MALPTSLMTALLEEWWFNKTPLLELDTIRVIDENETEVYYLAYYWENPIAADTGFTRGTVSKDELREFFSKVI